MLLNVSDLHIETNDNGFVLGKSKLGTRLGNQATQWREVRGDFSALTLTRSVALDKGVLFRPEAPQLTLRTRIEDYHNGVFGKTIRIRWKDETLFIGTIKNATVASQALRDNKDKTTVNVSAIGIVDFMNNYVLYNFDAPQQSVAARIAAIKPSTITINVTGGTQRLMAARTGGSPTLLDALQDAADVAQARFFVNKHDELIITDTNPPEPSILFSDDADDVNRLLYGSLNTQENMSNTITGVVVTAKSDQSQDKVFAVAQHPSATVTHEEVYSVDVPVDAGALEAWAESFPLTGSVDQYPTTLECFWQDALSELELTDQVDIKWKENGYRSGIKGITFDLEAEPDNKLRWNVKYDLFPGHLLGFNRLNAPSAVQNFRVWPVYNAELGGDDAHSKRLLWDAPAVPNGYTGYEIRKTSWATDLQPEKAAQTPLEGELVARLPAGTTEYIDTGIDAEWYGWYSIWAYTLNPDVRSPLVAEWGETRLDIPSAPQNFTATLFARWPGDTEANFRLEWTNPEKPAPKMTNYRVRLSTTDTTPDMSGPNTYGGISAGGVQYDGWLPAWGTNETSVGRLDLNVTYYFALYPVNGEGFPGKPAYTTGSSMETMPSPVRNVRTTVNSYNSITLAWDAPTTTGALGSYLVRWDRGGAPTLNSGVYWTTVPANGTRSLNFNAEGASTYGFTVWPKTNGGRIGTSGSTVATTPQGIFNKYWEGEAVWSQSYRSNNQFSSLARGNNIDMYYGYGDSYNGNQRSMMGFALPNNIAGAYAVDRVELHMYNKHTWYNTGADAWFGTHTWTTKPGTFQQSGANQAIYHLGKPGWLHVDATWWLAQSLKNGAKGITLGPAPNNSYSYYGFAAGVGGPRPVLKVWYRTIGS